MDAMLHPAGLLTALAFFASLIAAGLGGWALRGRAGGRQPPPGPRRLLSQAAMETQSIGLALRRIAGTRGRCAVETHALALQLLDVSDQLDDMLANSHGPRHLHEERVALLPLVEDCLATARVQLGAHAAHALPLVC